MSTNLAREAYKLQLRKEVLNSLVSEIQNRLVVVDAEIDKRKCILEQLELEEKKILDRINKISKRIEEIDY